MNTLSHVPPGFRFHPTDEELVDYYLRKKVTARRIDLDVIKDVDLYKIEPWDLQELCRIGTEEENEWYFFSHKDKKYPTGTRTNRATVAGFWKATGRDKAIYSKLDLIGMRKTLVFYKGRAPNGLKSDWIMHEYRLETDENGTPQEEGWVVCRVFKKRIANMRKVSEHESPVVWYDEQVSFLHDNNNNNNNNIDSPKPYSSPSSCKKEEQEDYYLSYQNHHHQSEQEEQLFLQLPLLENNPRLLQPVMSYAFNISSSSSSSLIQEEAPPPPPPHHHHQELMNNNNNNNEVTDWRVLDRFVASQLSHEDVATISKGSECSNAVFQGQLSNKQEMAQENASTSSSGYQTDLWK